jgi:multisubunit Na+/H+ antiporter MnhG subunit
LPFLIMNRFQADVNAVRAGFIYCFEPIITAFGALYLPDLLVRAGGAYSNETFSIRLFIGGSLILAANLILLRDPIKSGQA